MCSLRFLRLSCLSGLSGFNIVESFGLEESCQSTTGNEGASGITDFIRFVLFI